MGKKKFIDKKKSATFQLFARDSSDPTYADGPSGDRVFVRIDNNPYSIDAPFDEPNDDVSADPEYSAADDDFYSKFADAPDDCDSDGGDVVLERPPPLSGAAPLPDHVRREILELGFPDDGYNYLNHLREIKNTGGGSAYYHNDKAKLDQLSQDVKAYDASRVGIAKTSVEASDNSIYSVASKTIGVRVQKAVDPEVAALLDDSDLSRFGSDDEDLDEDFVVKANLGEELEEEEFVNKFSAVEDLKLKMHEINYSNASCSQENLADVAGVAKIRNYPLNVMEDGVGEKQRARRPLDEQFDMLELNEYGTESEEECCGSLAEENECHESLLVKLNHTLKDRAMDDLELNGKYKVPKESMHDDGQPQNMDSLESAADVIQRCLEYAEKFDNDNDDNDVVILEESSDESEKWDCDTIVSTYSNLENHPGKIDAPGTRRKLAEKKSQLIALKGKEKLPVDFLPRSQKSGSEKMKDVGGLRTEQPKRKQHGQESKEEKKERKAAVKEDRREARRVKKEVKGLYRCEAQLAQKVAAFTGPSSIHLM